MLLKAGPVGVCKKHALDGLIAQFKSVQRSLRVRNGRVLKPELLESATPVRASENLRDLVRINRWFGGQRILRELLSGVVAPDEHFSLLDVGAASGDMGASVRWGYPSAEVTSLDHRLDHLRFATPPRLVGDAFQLPFREKSFDVVTCSLLLHQFPDDQVMELMAQFYRMARRALIALDLYRHPVAYHFLPATRWLFGWGEVTLHDGPASVEASFLPHELHRLARAAGLNRVMIRKHFPWFRLSLVARTKRESSGAGVTLSLR